MKKLDTELIGALLKKQRIESVYRYRRGKFDVMGFLLSALLIAAIIALFVVFFGKFVGIYTQIKGVFGVEGTEARPDFHYDLRLYELLTLLYAIVFVFMTVGAISQINRQIFDADGARLYSAMPIDATSLYVAKIITIYLSQFFISTLVVLTVNFTAAFNAINNVTLGWQFWVVTAATCFLLPLLTIAVGSLLALPVNAVKRFLKDKFVLNFLLVTAVTCVAFWIYSLVLDAAKQMLLGDDLKYFFDERKMTVIVKAVQCMYPVKWLVDLLLAQIGPENLGVGHGALIAGLGIAGVLVLCIALSLVMLRFMLQRALQSRNTGGSNYLKRGGNLQNGKYGFFALVKKDFLLIFRTPSYMFSYLSVAVVMPLMVYFCMTVGSSLIESLVGLQLDLELALFLTLLFGALTNIFCATNISRDGEMFYSVKAYPLGYKSVFFSKIFLCMVVTMLSQLANAVVLSCTGNVSWYAGLFVFAVGTAFGFVNICVATRYDFNHAHFSTDEDGEIKESNGVVSTIIVFGVLTAFLVGGLLFIMRVMTSLRQIELGYLTYVVGSAASIICAGLAYLYFMGKLGKKYYKFEGGEI